MKRVQTQVEDKIPERHEFKYAISLEQRDQIRRAMEGICTLDKNAVHAPNNAYAIISLYLDSPSFTTHKLKADRAYHRFKLRMRTYDADEAPVFFEIKRRYGDIIKKTRARVSGDLQTITEQPASDFDPGVHDFSRMALKHFAEPKLMVRYRREAWASEIDDYARVTFDTHIEFQPWREWNFDVPENGYLPADDPRTLGVNGSFVILELKFPKSPPLWMCEMVDRFELWRRGFSKYCSGIDQLYGRRRSTGRLSSIHPQYE